ncbi:RNA polymerase sigma factor [Limnoglobus roseus]|uniref:Sigma-70 family RNA polymerase sigma factor n=1 Tax=Limnoglobus roseus TaxID=2598579 RepID=A0A5C1A7K8_9BACT|nr:RNA polymerase sigma factor [Limnoglobus roseus]QEL14455.1 sigma-70 family RNA polymerase sigma factor [Limnoglobus roseus]
MTVSRAANLFQRIRAEHDAGDAELLRRFAESRDAAAFTVLVQRHGPLVLGVCRRTLGHAHDAEDAFQAVFLVLAQKAGRLRDSRLLSSWLYGVAWRIAKKAKRRAARRREELWAAVPEPPTADGAMNDLGPVLDEELAALPEWYRDAILACDVGQLSRTDAAAKLSIPEGTLSSRLAAGRKRLADRLARRGVTLALPLLATMTTAGVSEALIQQTVETAVQWAAGGTVAKPITELTHEGLTMLRKLLLLGTGVLTATAVGIGLADDPVKPPETKPETKPAEVKVETKPTPEVVRYGVPKMKKSIDLQIAKVEALSWTPDGRYFAIHGTAEVRTAVVQGDKMSYGYTTSNGVYFYAAALASTRPVSGLMIRPKEKFLGWAADGRSITITSGQTGRINSQKRATLLPVFDAAGKPVLDYPSVVLHAEPTTTLALEPEYSEALGYTSDGKTLATFEKAAEGKADGKLVLRSAETGEPKKTLSVGAARVLHTARDFSRVAGIVVDEPKKADRNTGLGATPRLYRVEVLADGAAWTVKIPDSLDLLDLKFDGDGNRLLVAYGTRAHHRPSNGGYPSGGTRPRTEPENAAEPMSTVVSYDAATGKEVFRFTNDTYTLSEVQASFDGRLVASGATTGSDYFLLIIDTVTGSVLKKWPLSNREKPLAAGPFSPHFLWAFSPTEPKLLVLEPGEESGTVSVGLWEFPAEKK